MYTVNAELLARLDIPPGILIGRTALVTGGARGIGEGAALTMAHLGARIVVVDIRPSGRHVVEAIAEQGGQAKYIECDLSDVDQLMAMLPEAEAAFGPIDILLNNALYLHAAPVVEFGLDEWDKTFDTNARAPFLMIIVAPPESSAVICADPSFLRDPRLNITPAQGVIAISGFDDNGRLSAA